MPEGREQPRNEPSPDEPGEIISTDGAKEIPPTTENVVIDPEHPENIPPEIIEMVMKKVDDIQKEGTMFSDIVGVDDKHSLGKLSSILANGLLSLPWGWLSAYRRKFNIPPEEEINIVDAWKVILKRQRGVVHFNIVGKMADLESSSGLADVAHYRNGRVGMLFDISDWKKHPQPVHPFAFDNPDFEDAMQAKLRTIYPGYDHGDREDISLPPDQYTPSSGSGYMAGIRIPPRRFRGIYVDLRDRMVAQDELDVETVRKYLDQFKDKKSHFKDIIRVSAPPGITQDVLKTMLTTYADKPERLLPVYDTDGNLLWPKQMSHEEIQTLLADKLAAEDNNDKSL